MRGQQPKSLFEAESVSKTLIPLPRMKSTIRSGLVIRQTVMILPQVHLRKPCYDFYFL
jgi:hypothetical protein